MKVPGLLEPLFESARARGGIRQARIDHMQRVAAVIKRPPEKLGCGRANKICKSRHKEPPRSVPLLRGLLCRNKYSCNRSFLRSFPHPNNGRVCGTRVNYQGGVRVIKTRTRVFKQCQIASNTDESRQTKERYKSSSCCPQIRLIFYFPRKNSLNQLRILCNLLVKDRAECDRLN